MTGRIAFLVVASLVLAAPVRAGNVIATSHEQVVWHSVPQEEAEYGEGSIEWGTAPGPKAPLPLSPSTDPSVVLASFNTSSPAGVVAKRSSAPSIWRPKTWRSPSSWQTATLSDANSPAAHVCPAVTSIDNSR